ncbi:MBL fold metallo-hydrolase [Bradyrhizobium sp. CCGUVB4N]|uniref:MBL fold metallo-hydrolase n=1 Tax=Bradyrhizobium sp. CCGUVB4N TaxID=2949631 RepID=UPI0020B28B38|nr:MBL fold metallo-hydrolase [Bradyrhizobium sp. CCGUVB4N]MCP3385999.1 MBL fold metallo-hydrolase [Bradyrhizobium sp. CCGUVB4N]
MKPEAGGSVAGHKAITIRMYRKGLGDCLLLGIPGSKRTFWMLVDCGLILGTPDAVTKIAEIVADVATVTDNHLDVLVVTHEHWDHVSGFVQAKQAFQALTIDALWMAWTEDPKDKLATRLRREREEKLKKLVGFVANLGARGLAAESVATGISSVLSFFNFGFGAVGGSTRDALANARGFVNGKEPIYWRPDDPPLTPPQAPCVRIFALGPPHDEKAIKKTFAKSEVYHVGAVESAVLAADQSAIGAGTPWDAFSPFDRDVGVALRPLVDAPRFASGSEDPDPLRNFLERHYLDPDPAVDEEGQDWRRIDNAWLGPAADFALALDSATNNTSLVLAIEIIESGKVILLPGDAQVGSWLSWQECVWQVAGRPVTGPELLGRTVFYKVGHHGSHNATLREKGLELMTSPELVAFIPVNREVARQKGWEEMPFLGLVQALNERTQGRVLQADRNYVLNATAASRAFAAELKQTPLFLNTRYRFSSEGRVGTAAWGIARALGPGTKMTHGARCVKSSVHTERD